MTDSDPLEHYRELLRRDPGFGGPLCITWCQGVTAVVAGRFGADLATAAPSTLDEAREAEPDYQVPLPTVLLVGDLGDGWSLAVEINGFQGTRKEVLRALTPDGGRAYSAYWNINLDNRIVLAADGVNVGSLEPFDGDHMWGADPARLSRHFDGLPLGLAPDALIEVPDIDIKAAALLVGERATGRRIDAGWPDRRHVRYLIDQQLPEDGPTTDGLAAHPLVRADPRLRALVADPDLARLPALLHDYVSAIIDYAGLRDEPDVTRALTMLTRRPGEDEVEQAGQRLEALFARVKKAGLIARARSGGDEGPDTEAGRLFRQLRALRALVDALRPDPVEAMEEAIWSAGSGWPGIKDRLTVLRDCFELVRAGPA